MDLIEYMVLLLVSAVSASPPGLRETRSDARAESSAHSLGAGLGIGPFNIGAVLNSASAKAQSSASSYDLFRPVSSNSQAQSVAHSLGGALDLGFFNIGANLNSAFSTAHSSVSSLNYGYDPLTNFYGPGYAVGHGDAHAIAQSQNDYSRPF